MEQFILFFICIGQPQPPYSHNLRRFVGPVDVWLKEGSAAETLAQKTLYGTNLNSNNIGRIAELQAQDGKTYFS
jgi:hypothetical protein